MQQVFHLQFSNNEEKKEIWWKIPSANSHPTSDSHMKGDIERLPFIDKQLSVSERSEDEKCFYLFSLRKFFFSLFYLFQPWKFFVNVFCCYFNIERMRAFLEKIYRKNLCRVESQNAESFLLHKMSKLKAFNKIWVKVWVLFQISTSFHDYFKLAWYNRIVQSSRYEEAHTTWLFTFFVSIF